MDIASSRDFAGGKIFGHGAGPCVDADQAGIPLAMTRDRRAMMAARRTKSAYSGER
jgi:hypothetical protein